PPTGAVTGWVLVACTGAGAVGCVPVVAVAWGVLVGAGVDVAGMAEGVRADTRVSSTATVPAACVRIWFASMVGVCGVDGAHAAKRMLVSSTTDKMFVFVRYIIVPFLFLREVARIWPGRGFIQRGLNFLSYSNVAFAGEG